MSCAFGASDQLLTFSGCRMSVSSGSESDASERSQAWRAPSSVRVASMNRCPSSDGELVLPGFSRRDNVSAFVGAALSKYASAGADASCDFSFLKAVSCSSVHSNGVPWRVSFRSGSAVVARFGMNRLLNSTRPRKLRTSAAFFDCCASVTACAFSSVGPIPMDRKKKSYELNSRHPEITRLRVGCQSSFMKTSQHLQKTAVVFLSGSPVDDNVVGNVNSSRAVSEHLSDDVLELLWCSINSKTEPLVPAESVLRTKGGYVA